METASHLAYNAPCQIKYLNVAATNTSALVKATHTSGATFYVSINLMSLPYAKAQMTCPTLNISALNGGNTGDAVFKLNDAIQTGVNYTITDQSNLPSGFDFSTSTGRLTVAANTQFKGGNYVITGTKNNVSASVEIFVQSYTRQAVLTVSKPNINSSNKTSGTSTMTVDGTVVTGTGLSYTTSPVLPTGQGLTLNASSGVIT
jgi:hypothetical protein